MIPPLISSTMTTQKSNSFHRVQQIIPTIHTDVRMLCRYPSVFFEHACLRKCRECNCLAECMHGATCVTVLCCLVYLKNQTVHRSVLTSSRHTPVPKHSVIPPRVCTTADLATIRVEFVAAADSQIIRHVATLCIAPDRNVMPRPGDIDDCRRKQGAAEGCRFD